MKKKLLIMMLVCVCFGVFAEDPIYVSHAGNGFGWDETEPATLALALTQVFTGASNKIIIIGVLDMNSTDRNNPAVFDFNDISGTRGGFTEEIVISGKPGASGDEKAILSARGSGKAAVRIRNLKIRFEHIEITGGEGQNGNGLWILNGANVTLGPGAVVRENLLGINLQGTCTVDGGDVRDNQGRGILVTSGGVLTIRGGSVRNNRGGVEVVGGRLTMVGGSIDNNRGVDVGGGVALRENSTFSLTGGYITNNRADTAGGGVAINGNSTLNQTGGFITRNTAERGGGGGVTIERNSTFTQTGGAITGNTADRGGGVFVSGRYEQTGGTVSDNTANQGSNTNVFRSPGSSSGR
jgi:hypothetical protein